MQTYCIRLCIPILHGNSCDRQKAHCHTIEVTAYVQKESVQFESFSTMERRINSYLDRYANQFLNVLPEFQKDSSIESIAEVIFSGLTETLQKDGLTLSRLEVGETPLRQYIIGILD